MLMYIFVSILNRTLREKERMQLVLQGACGMCIDSMYVYDRISVAAGGVRSNLRLCFQEFPQLFSVLYYIRM